MRSRIRRKELSRTADASTRSVVLLALAVAQLGVDRQDTENFAVAKTCSLPIFSRPRRFRNRAGGHDGGIEAPGVLSQRSK